MLEFLETFTRIYGENPEFMENLIDIYFYTVLLFILTLAIIWRKNKIHNKNQNSSDKPKK